MSVEMSQVGLSTRVTVFQYEEFPVSYIILHFKFDFFHGDG